MITWSELLRRSADGYDVAMLFCPRGVVKMLQVLQLPTVRCPIKSHFKRHSWALGKVLELDGSTVVQQCECPQCHIYGSDRGWEDGSVGRVMLLRHEDLSEFAFTAGYSGAPITPVL